MKKGQGLPMNVIIIAALSLLVLVIISVLVLRAGGNVNQNTGCTGVSGICVQSDGDLLNACDSGYTRSAAHGCANDGEVCCIPIN